MRAIIAILVGYIVGSIPFSFIIARLVGGVDLRKTGSRNVGGSNAIRTVGFVPGLMGGLLDVFKAPLVPFLLDHLGYPLELQFAAGLAAVIGHNWPLFLGFKGGRGVACSLGLLLYFAPRELIFLLVIMGISMLLREAALGAFLGYTLMIPFAILVGESRPTIAFLILLYFILMVRRVSFVFEDKKRGLDIKKAIINRILYDSVEKVKLERPL